MRKIWTFFILICVAVSSSLVGCGKQIINLSSDKFMVSVNTELSTNVGDYVRASKKMLDSMTLDVSKVDMKRIGTYDASVSYKGTTKDFKITVADLAAPEITLNADKIYLENSGKISLSDVVASVEDYSKCEYGFSNNLVLADKDKTTTDTLSFDSVGEYQAEVLAKDIYNNYSVKEFKVCVVKEGETPVDEPTVVDYAQYMNSAPGVELGDIGSYDTWALYFGIGAGVDENNRPDVSYYSGLYGQYAVDFIQPQSKYIWLTYNETYEHGYTGKTLDILKEKGVIATFFITKSYAEHNPELVKRMVDEGHIIGNYTSSLANIGDLGAGQITQELNDLHTYMLDNYNYNMYLFRPPSGYFNEQALAVAQQLGYRTVFWSFAYADWDTQNQPVIAEALKNALDRAHGGAIYSLSGASSTNQRMLSDFIDGIRNLGYDFALYQKVQ